MSLKGAKYSLILLLALTTITGTAQDRKLGTWKMYLSYHNSIGVCDAGDRVYSAAFNSIFSVEKSTGIIQTYDKASGLSDVGIQSISYDADDKVLAIAYTNSNIDLLFNGTDVYNIPDIKNQNSSGGITIFGISFYDGNAYVSSTIGISAINLAKKEVSNTYIIGLDGSPVKVYSSCIDGTNIYAATDNGIEYAPLNAPNLLDFNSWHLFNYTQGIPAMPASLLATANHKVYAVIKGSGNASDTIYEFNGVAWSVKYYSGNDSIVSIITDNNTVYFADINQLNNANLDGQITAADSVIITPVQQHYALAGWFESNGIAWEADINQGLFKNDGQGNIENIVPDGPGSNDAFGLDIKDGIVYVAGGGVDESWTYKYKKDGFYVYKNNKWYSHNPYTDPIISNYSDIINAACSPGLGKTYFGSFYSGLVQYDNASNTITNVYDNSNSTLETDNNDPGRVKISSLAFDRYDNLWIGNAGATQPIQLLKPDGSWLKFSVPYVFADMKQILIDDNDQLWSPLRSVSGGGLLVWSYNGTLDNTSDDVSRLLTIGSGRGNLPSNNVYCAVQDKEGNVWIGTDAGIGVFYCPGSILTTSGCDAEQIKVVRDGFVGYLFGTESVRAIAVDAANRKWVGTNNGLWLISADGQTQLLSFNASNSPMPADQVINIAINDITGEVFIATTAGLISYQGDAIDTCVGCREALVYPNPVKPDYTGPIAIKGLTDNAYVKITDVSGTLVYQGYANGTQMIWNGTGYNGNRVKSGIYVVFSSNDKGKMRKVAKILVTN
ncbi:MAG TPA: two-component regulator propeller domain-containing protein [Chitinophagales bacterium]|nr:two-component regulator propeller domain-containing protein [Chitinophagales bacterium]